MQKLSKWSVDSRVLIVKYEKLVLEPQRSILSIFEFLEVEPMPLERINERRGGPEIERREHWAREHFKAADGAISTDSLAKWKSELTPRQTVLVECITRTGMRQMNYVITDKLTLIDCISAYVEVIQLVLRKPDILLRKLFSFK